MRALFAVFLLFCPGIALTQSTTVLPSELTLWVEVEETDHVPLTREMVLITIKGVYRRHITRENLIQPDFDGFSWTQLGDDTWREERLDGEKVKTFSRRMAIYPDRAGQITVGAFRHDLTLTDENDDWFQHEIVSEPVTIEVAPAPESETWWFPVRQLKVSDEWSNAPDQLTPGEGVLRVIRIEAQGVTPEMIPPMPTLNSPSAMIFPHPEKRFVELSPQGPQSFAFWRWTIRPSNTTSTIVEPLSFSYFDTVNRVDRTVTISPQRIAYGKAVPTTSSELVVPDFAKPSRLPGWPVASLAAFVFLAGVMFAMSGRRLAGFRALQRFSIFDPLARQMRQSERKGDLPDLRRVAAAILHRDGPSDKRQELLWRLDRAIFDPKGPAEPLKGFAKSFLHGT